MRVYVSSTFRDLKEHRRAVVQAIREAGYDCNSMEIYPAFDERPLERCLKDVARCDIYVGVFAHRYGFRPQEKANPNNKSITELEYRAASDKPRLTFFIDPKHPWPEEFKDTGKDAEDLAALRAELQVEHGVKWFTTPEDLAARVLAALSSWRESGSLDRRPLQHRRFLASNFTGRQAELADLEKEVRQQVKDGAAIGFWGFRGLGGVGKSALAAELAERLSAVNDGKLFPGGVLWVDLLNDKQEPHEAAAGWLRAYDVDTADLSPAECLTRFHEEAARRRPLIVVDNAQRRDQVEALLVKAQGVVVFVTTRDMANLPAEVVRSYQVDQLQPDDAFALLKNFASAQVADEATAAERVCQQCGFLPVFLRIAGSQIRSDEYLSVAEYANELADRGLATLADHDDRAAAIFDISWESLKSVEREIFSAASQFPGPSFGANFVQAWLGVEGRVAQRILTRLENASLLIKEDRQPDEEDAAHAREPRYRMHDRVRDYAESKLEGFGCLADQVSSSPAKASFLKRLLNCWSDWEFVESELTAIEADELAREYFVLRQRRDAGRGENTRRVSGADAARDDDDEPFDVWFHFIRGQAHVLAYWPELFFQQAYNEAVESLISHEAQRRATYGNCPQRFLEWINRPKEYAPPACLQVLFGHDSTVTEVAFHPDGCRAVSGSWDNTVRVWDLESGRCTAVLEGHSDWVTSVAVSGDGRRAVSGSDDDTMRVWDLESGRCTAVLEGHNSWVQSVALSGDGCRAVSGSWDDTVRVWDLESGRCTAVLEGHSKLVTSVALSVAGRRAVSGSDDNTVRVWDLESSSCTAVLEGHSRFVTSVALSGDGCRAISGSDDNTMRVWDLESGRCTAVLEGHRNMVTSVALSGDGRRAVSGSWDNTVRVWDLDVESDCCIAVLEGHNDLVDSVALSGDGRSAVSGSQDDTVRVWDLESGCCTTVLEGLSDKVNSVALSRDGRCAVSGSWDNTVRVWDLESDRCVAVLEGHNALVDNVALSGDGRSAVSGSWDNTVRVWDLESGRCTAVMKGHSDVVTSLAISGDGRRAVSGSRDNTVRVWDLERGRWTALLRGRCTAVLEGHSKLVMSVAISGDGRRAVSGSRDNTVRVWNLERGRWTALLRGRCTAVMKGHDSYVISVALSGDGRRAVSGSIDGTIRVWDLETGECLETHPRDSEAAERAWDSVHDSGLYRVSRVEDVMTIRNVQSGETIACFPELCTDAACSADGRYAIGGSGNGQVYLLRLRTAPASSP